jgi:hypothetical protein
LEQQFGAAGVEVEVSELVDEEKVETSVAGDVNRTGFDGDSRVSR